MKRWIAITVLILMFISCGEKPVFIDVREVNIEGLKDDQMIVHMDYVVFNPNNVRTKLRESEMEILYKTARVGTGYLNNPISLAANDTIEVPVRCEISLEKLSIYYPELLEADSAEFNIRGSGKVKFLLNSITMEMGDKIYLNTSKIIRAEIDKNLNTEDNFKIRSVKASKLPSLTTTELELEVEAKNNLPFDYKINAMELDFYLDEERSAVARWEMNSPLEQTALDSRLIPVNVNLKNFNLLRQARLRWLTRQQVDFDILGEVEIQIQDYIFKVPIKDSLTLSL